MKSKKSASAVSVTHFDAVGAWEFGDLTDLFASSVPEVIFRDETIVIDWAPVDGFPTLTKLNRLTDGNYVGESLWASRSPKEQTAKVHAVLYSNEQGHILVGEEKWSSGEQDWFVLQLRNARQIPSMSTGK